MTSAKIARLVALCAACTIVGAAGGIAGSAAHDGGGHGFFRGPIHAEAVVPNQAGTGFDTITSDRGKVKAVSGNQLTITEGTDQAVYKEPTLTIPDGAKVFRNRAPAALSALQPGDFVRVVQGPRGTLVVAKDPSFMGHGERRGVRHHR